jgi:hypothetical protein
MELKIIIDKSEEGVKHPITQHIRCGLTPLPFGTLLSTIATPYMLKTLYAIAKIKIRKLFIYPHLFKSQEGEK